MRKNDSESLKTLLTDLYQLLQIRYEEQAITTNERECSVKQVNVGFPFLLQHMKRGGVYLLSGATPAVNRATVEEIFLQVLDDNKTPLVVAVFLTKGTMQDWGMDMLSRFSSVPLSRMETGKFGTDDWRKLASATGYLADLNIALHESENEEVFLDQIEALQREKQRYDYIFIDSVDMETSMHSEVERRLIKRLQDAAHESEAVLITSCRSFRSLQYPEVRELV